MNEKAIALLKKERICVLSVVLADGSPHAAEMHFSAEFEPVKLFFQTYPTVKTKTIEEKGGFAKAAVVVGLSEADFVSLQMRGDIRIVKDKKELENLQSVHYAKLPEAKKYKNSESIFLEFTPTWWRYSDFNTDPETVVEGK